MASYDPTKVIMTWASILIQGPMDDSFFEAEHKEDDVEFYTGADGEGSYVENPNKQGTVKISLRQNSASNVALSIAFGKRTAGQLLIVDGSDTTKTLCSGAAVRIGKHAAPKRGKSMSGMEWMFVVPRLVIVAGGDI